MTDRTPLLAMTLGLILALFLVMVRFDGWPFVEYRINGSGNTETSAISTLRTIVTAQTQYSQFEPARCYGFLSELSNTTPPYIDSIVANGSKSGYCFVLRRGVPADSGYRVFANPTRPGVTGIRHFYTDQTGVIRFHEKRSAGPGDRRIDG